MLHKVNRRNSLLLVSPFFTQKGDDEEEEEEKDIKSTEKSTWKWVKDLQIFPPT